jgi:NADPH-dependent 2,4-dienoyl-CoA reductase/sulfur reductase-like enzyme/rhodanese-related sulfurtransferase
MKVIIIGGVAGGASAAARLRRLDENVQIIMLEKGPYISFANCGLPYYISGQIPDVSQLTVQTPARFKQRFNVDVRVNSEAVKIDRQNKTVYIRYNKETEYTETYDKLILSTGAEPIVPDISGIDDERIFTLRTIPDALRIKNYIVQSNPKNAVIVGGGFIGVEMAENLLHLGINITIVEAADHILSFLDYDMAQEAQLHLRKYGAKLILKNGVKSFEKDGEKIPADMVILSIGVKPDTKLAIDAGLDCTDKGAIVVDEYLRTSDKDIYAVGDAVVTFSAISNQMLYVPLAGPANKQGRIAADNICGYLSAYKGAQSSSIIRFFGTTIASTGLNEKMTKSAGYDYDKVYLRTVSHASYYPGAEPMLIKVIFERKSGVILGTQIVGGEGVDKQCDILATAIRHRLTAFDLTELDFCYSPPYGSAKDPVNMVGYSIENILTGKIKQFHWHDIPSIQSDSNAIILDVRTNDEYATRHIEKAKHIPVDNLRERIAELDKSKKIYVYCHSGMRSYIACRILTQNGFECYNLGGGFSLYNMINKY